MNRILQALASPGLGFTMVGVNLASGWDEFPHDCTENMEIREMGFYRLEHLQSKISWEKFRQATTKIMKDKYGRRIIDPEKEDIQWPKQEKP